MCAGAGTTLVLVERTHVRRASGHLCISYRVTGVEPVSAVSQGARAGPPARARTSQNGLNAARRPFLFFCFRSSFKRTPRDRHASTKLIRLPTTSSHFSRGLTPVDRAESRNKDSRPRSTRPLQKAQRSVRHGRARAPAATRSSPVPPSYTRLASSSAKKSRCEKRERTDYWHGYTY